MSSLGAMANHTIGVAGTKERRFEFISIDQVFRQVRTVVVLRETSLRLRQPSSNRGLGEPQRRDPYYGLQYYVIHLLLTSLVFLAGGTMRA